MTNEETAVEHYLHGNLLGAIQAALPGLGKSARTLNVDDLALVDEFHVGGREATERLVERLGFTAQDHVLDGGCGLGGPARRCAESCRCHVSGIDLSTEYIEVGQSLCAWLKLEELVTLVQGSALAMPCPNEGFDGGYMTMWA